MERIQHWLSNASFAWDGGLFYALIYFLLAALVLLHYLPEGRRPLLVAGVLLALSFASFLAGGALVGFGILAPAQFLGELAILLEGVAVIRITSVLLFRLVLPRWHLAPPRIVQEIVTVIAYLAFGLLRLRYAGLELSGIVTTSAVITGVIAFSMQDTLGNILGGVALQLDSSLRVGDWIKIDDVTGKVVDIRWRSTSIETRNWETVVVPNSALMRGKFLVLGRRKGEAPQWRRWLWFYVGYETSPGEVIRVVEQAVSSAEIPNVSRAPAPSCVMMDFERLSGKYALRYWLTDFAVDDPTDSVVRQHIHAALTRNGISAFIPESYLNIAAPKQQYTDAIEERELNRRLDVLKKIDLFTPLTEAELSQVAAKLRPAPFIDGDYMTTQGAVAHWLYIVIAGRAEAVLDDGQRKQHLGWIDAEEGTNFFGEMGLMTGSRRTATVIARTDVDCYRLDKDAFEGIMQGRPQLAQDLSQIIEARRSGLESAATQLAAQAERSRRQQQPELLARIREFFNLE